MDSILFSTPTPDSDLVKLSKIKVIFNLHKTFRLRDPLKDKLIYFYSERQMHIFIYQQIWKVNNLLAGPVLKIVA